jgi:hypothetical protein
LAKQIKKQDPNNFIYKKITSLAKTHTDANERTENSIPSKQTPKQV